VEVTSVLLARAIGWVEVIDLNPRGKTYYPSLVEGLVQRYGFAAYPQKLEDFDEVKGVKFTSGRAGETVIEQAIIYTHGILLDTRDSTETSQRILEGILEWGANEFGLAYQAGTIKRWAYYSQVTFTSDVSLSFMHPALQRLCMRMGDVVQDISGEKLKYEPANLTLNHDLLLRQHPYGSFSIQKRAGVPFSENQYFSDAPLPTDIHLQLLSDFEQEIIASLPEAKRITE
jgi:hypothetical protein